MRICRFDHDRIGVVKGDVVHDVSGVLAELDSVRWPLPAGDLFVGALDRLRPTIKAEIGRGPQLPLSELQLLSPVANPTKIIAAPLNYPLHVLEAADSAINHGVHYGTHDGFETPIDKFGLFLKSPTGLIGCGEEIVLPFPDRRNDHEVELAVIIGRKCRHVSRQDALTRVAGYAIGLDMTIRGPEDRSYRKSPDSFSVLGPWLVTADEIPEPDALEFSIRVDGELRQHSNTARLIVDVRDLIVRASALYTLYPGDIILTGTPEGVGEVHSGSLLEASIERIGDMQVRVA